MRCDNCVGVSEDADIHCICDECMQEELAIDASIRAEKDAHITSLEAEVARLTALLPTDVERACLLGCVAIASDDEDGITIGCAYLNRIDAARAVPRG